MEQWSLKPLEEMSAIPRGLPDMKHGICGSGVGWGGVLLVGELGCPIALGYCRLKAAPWMEYRWVRAVAYLPSPLQAQGLVVDFWCCRVLSSYCVWHEWVTQRNMTVSFCPPNFVQSHEINTTLASRSNAFARLRSWSLGLPRKPGTTTLVQDL